MTAAIPDGRSRRWRNRLTRWAEPEVGIGAAIAATWAWLGITVGFGTPIGGVAAVVAIVVLHLVAVETGNHTLAWMTTAALVVFVVVALRRWPAEVPPLAYTLAAVTAVAHSDLIRLNHARRRRARLDRQPVLQALGGTATAGLLALAGIGIASGLGQAGNRNWLWMPATVGALILLAAALTVLPVRRAPAASRTRWRPGDRMPPPIHQEAGDGPGPDPVGAGPADR